MPHQCLLYRVDRPAIPCFVFLMHLSGQSNKIQQRRKEVSESETEPESDLDDVDTQQRESRTTTVIDISDDEVLASR